MSKISEGVAISATSLKKLPRLGAVCLGLVGAALAFAPPSSAATTNWFQSYYDAGHTSYNAQETTLSKTNVHNLTFEWGSSVATGGVTSFVLNQGVIYAQGQGSSNSGVLVAINATNGAKIWSTTTQGNGAGLNTIAVGNALVFTACTFTPKGKEPAGGICAYRQANGSRVWVYIDECNCEPISAVVTSLVYSNSVVYFGYAFGGSNEPQNWIAALDAKTGGVLWTYDTGGDNSLGTATPVVGNGRVFFTCAPSSGANICAVNQSDGSFAWATPFGSGDVGLSLGTDNVLYVNGGSAGEFAALNSSTGAVLWSDTGVNSSATPISAYGGVLFATGSDGSVHKLARTTGAESWSVNIGSESSVTLANGVFYNDQQGSNASETSAYAMSTGALLWAGPTPASTLHPPPIVANGTVYITNASCGSVCAYDLPE